MRLTHTLPVICALCLYGCATGSVHVVGKQRPAIAADQVKVNPTPATNYEVIGTVRAKSNAGWNIEQCHAFALDQLRHQAAKIGANAIIFLPAKKTQLVGEDAKPLPNSMGGTSTVPFLSHKQDLQALAVYIPQKADTDTADVSDLFKLLTVTSPNGTPQGLGTR